MEKYKNGWLGYVLALAIAFNTLLPFFALYSHNVPSPASLKLASIFGEKLLICTGDGFALVNWKDLMTGKAPVKPHKSYDCALCYTSTNSIGKLLLFAVLTGFFSYRKKLSASLGFLYHCGACKPLDFANASPRAPPYSFC